MNGPVFIVGYGDKPECPNFFVEPSLHQKYYNQNLEKPKIDRKD